MIKFIENIKIKITGVLIKIIKLDKAIIEIKIFSI